MSIHLTVPSAIDAINCAYGVVVVCCAAAVGPAVGAVRLSAVVGSDKIMSWTVSVLGSGPTSV